MNLIEVIFGTIAPKVIRQGSFTSKQDLKEKLEVFVDYYNRTFCQAAKLDLKPDERKRYATSAQEAGVN